MNGGAPPFNSACGELSVLCGVGSGQDFPRGGRQQATSVNNVLLEAGSMGQLKDLSSCHCYPCSPGISSKWIWPLAKQPVHTSLIRVFLCMERMEAGVEVEGEQLAPSLPKCHERAAEHPTPGWARGFEGQQLSCLMGSGSVHLGCAPPAATANGERK